MVSDGLDALMADTSSAICFDKSLATLGLRTASRRQGTI